MDDPTQHQNPILQLAELLTEEATGEVFFERSRDFVNKIIEPLSEQEVRHFLTSNDDALLVLLNKLQPQDTNTMTVLYIFVRLHGWVLLCKGLGIAFHKTGWDDAQHSPGRRLYIKLLLRHIDLLCRSAAAMFSSVGTVASSVFHDIQRSHHTPTDRLIKELRCLGAVAADMLCLFTILLLGTHREQDAAAMVCTIGSIRTLYHFAEAVVKLGVDQRDAQGCGASFQFFLRLAPVVIERILVPLYPQRVDDVLACKLVPCAYCVLNDAASWAQKRSIASGDAVRE